jgi:hypothetical protein
MSSVSQSLLARLSMRLTQRPGFANIARVDASLIRSSGREMALLPIEKIHDSLPLIDQI